LRILVLNCGSSSLSYKLYEDREGSAFGVLAAGKAHRVGVKGSEAAFLEHRHGGTADSPLGTTTRQTVAIPDHRRAAELILAALAAGGLAVDAVGHRFLTAGSYFQSTTLLDAAALATLELCRPLAPIHNPNSLNAIYACQEALPGVAQFVVFDNAFHATLPDYASAYALPPDVIRRHGFRKYGFHGLSYAYVAAQVPQFLGRPAKGLRMVVCHLGTGGSSVAAIRDGRSLDTSMGFTPLQGLVMSTRCGDLDPLVPVYLAERGWSAEELTGLMNGQSGLLGLSGYSSDLRDLQRRAEEDGDERARLACAMYAYRIRKYIGSYAAVLGGLDVLAFTDDIGVQNWQVREQACTGLAWCGVEIDPAANRGAARDRIGVVSAEGAGVTVLVVPGDEELAIAEEGRKLLRSMPAGREAAR
jgi:acetate kinase